MNKFEKDNVYVSFINVGYGFDERKFAEYYKIVRRTEKSIWFKCCGSKDLVKFGKQLMTEEQARNINNISINDLENSELIMKRVRSNDYGEYFSINNITTVYAKDKLN